MFKYKKLLILAAIIILTSSCKEDFVEKAHDELLPTNSVVLEKGRLKFSTNTSFANLVEKMKKADGISKDEKFGLKPSCLSAFSKKVYYSNLQCTNNNSCKGIRIEKR